jgi:hypothetical protein
MMVAGLRKTTRVTLWGGWRAGENRLLMPSPTTAEGPCRTGCEPHGPLGTGMNWRLESPPYETTAFAKATACRGMKNAKKGENSSCDFPDGIYIGTS